LTDWTQTATFILPGAWVNTSGASRVRHSLILLLLPTSPVMINYHYIKNIDGLCSNLGVDRSYLEHLIQSSVNHYTPFKIPKRGKKGWRQIYVANDTLNAIHKIIRDDLSEKTTSLWPEYVQGFVKGRSIATNAKLHLSKKVILNLDINSYFESIKKEKVAKVFYSLGAIERISNLLAEICTCNGYLVPGTACAPVISNLIFSDCDRDLFNLANESQCAYSRYVDDITFSGDKPPSFKNIDSILNSHGFKRNERKTFRQFRGLRQYVTGLTVFDSTMPRIPKWKKRELRKNIYYMDKFGIRSHLLESGYEGCLGDFVFRYDGLISFYNSIEPCFIRKYESIWRRIKDSSGF